MGDKYHKTRVHNAADGTKVASIVVWDGVKNYKDQPPIPALIAAEKFDANELLIMQVGKDWNDGRERFQIGMAAANAGCDVIFFAINHKVYRQICISIEAVCAGRLQ